MAEVHTCDNVYWYMSEVTSRVVAKSGIPTDRFHIGKIVLQSFKDDPDFIAQIDGGTGESETNGSLLKRSIQCAISFRNMGLKHGDVLIVMAPNHLDLAVVLYAALYLGIIVTPVDMTLKVGELSHYFNIYQPSAIFCQSDKIPEIQAALDNLKAKIFSFDRHNNVQCLADFIKAGDEEVANFVAEDFNAEESISIIIPTSGSTGFPKGAAITFKTWTITGPHVWARFTKFPSPTQSWLVLSPFQWLTAILCYITAPFMKYTRIQTSKPVTFEHTRYLINTYRPTFSAMSSMMILRLLKSVDCSSDSGQGDISCFDVIYIGGSNVDKDTYDLIKKVSPKTTIVNAYGMTELTTLAFQGDCPVGSCGKPAGLYQYRLINLETQKDIQEPNVHGELWIKGPMFLEYYNNPKSTAEAFTEDRWLKTGDMFYRDEHWNYYFVERIKLLLKYKNHQISPAEIEAVIREHPGVLDAAVTGIKSPECGDLPVACVIPKPGCRLMEEDIKNLVKEKLSDAKKLRGGVAIVPSFPLTSTSKVDRKRLHEMVKDMNIET